MYNRRQDKTQAVVLEAAPLTAKVLPARPDAPKTRLRLVSRRKNEITDDDAWFQRNKLTRPSMTLPNPQANVPGVLPEGMPATFEGNGIIGAYLQPDEKAVLGVYGANFSSGRYLVAWDITTKAIRYAFDLGKYIGRSRGETRIMGINYAREDDDGTLFLINDIGGYAKEAGGKNGYLTALEVATGKLLWRSAPLMANSRSFEILGETIACGYGFTAEPDYVYLLDKKTGRLLERLPVASAPEYLIRQGERLYVRCYDTDYVFAITGQ